MRRAARLRWVSAGVAAAAALALALARLVPAPPLQQVASYSHAFYDRDGALLRLTLAGDGQYRVWTPLERIDPRLVEAVQLYEDRWYRWHPGVNPASLLRGAWSSYSGGTRRGASTITMQLARRVARIDSRTPSGKLRQIGAALWLEARYSKDQILEAYLNLAPYGGNVEGAGAASLVLLGKRAAHLSLAEALALAVVPQNPNRRAGASAPAADAPAAAQPAALAAARARLWRAWRDRHPDPDAVRAASTEAEIAQPLRLRAPRDLPFAAPHAVQTLLAQLPQHPEIEGPEAMLALHGPTQAAVERAIAHFVAARRASGVRNAAALLVDAPTLQVKAWVGSADYGDAAIDGQVNATTARRSPGSTLKPFIYALALDQGILHPRTILKDAPTAFGTYSPENFDGRFEGPITAQDALLKSRNIPAVAVASRLGRPDLYDFLKLAGIGRMASAQHYGLALALGGGEVTMEELAGLYAMLANGGEIAPLAYRVAPPGPPAPAARQRLLSPEAAFVALDMLAHNPRPDTGAPAFPAVAWKTGTSWGFRDAWTAGVFGRSVLVVWVGNFDGSSNPAFVGVQSAAPLFFAIVDSLRSQGLDPGAAPRLPPRGLVRIDVCAASGDLPNAACSDLAPTWFIPGKSPIKVSTLHRALRIDRATGRATCADGPGVRTEVFEFWSSDMLQLFAQAGMPRRIPPRPPHCADGRVDAGAADRDAPQIVAPLAGATYLMRIAQRQALTLRANAPHPGRLYWFAEEDFIGTAEPGNDLEWSPPGAGRFRLRAVDARGSSDAREVRVEWLP